MSQIKIFLVMHVEKKKEKKSKYYQLKVNRNNKTKKPKQEAWLKSALTGEIVARAS